MKKLKLTQFKNVFQNYMANYNQAWHKPSLRDGTKVSTNKGHSILKKEIMLFISLQQRDGIIYCF